MSKKLPIVGRHLLRAGPVIVLCLCALVMGSSGAYGVVVSALHGAGTPGGETAVAFPLGTDTFTVHENLGLVGTNNHYGDESQPGEAGAPDKTPADAGFTFVTSLLSPFSTALSGGGTFAGSILSEVYRHTDGHLLFVYTITNTGVQAGTTTVADLGFSHGNLVDISTVNIIDAGELQSTDAFTAGRDYVAYERQGLSDPTQLTWYWQNSAITVAGGSSNGAKLEPAAYGGVGTSTPLYIETDVNYITMGFAGIIDGGGGVSNVPVLIPTIVPEPLTMLGLFLGLGGVGAYIRKRRMA